MVCWPPPFETLAKRPREDIEGFEERLALLLYRLDTKAHASHIGQGSYDPKNEFVSPDEFLYSRCVVVANGKEYYETVLHDPGQMPKDMEFEALLYLTSSAWESEDRRGFRVHP